MAVATTFHVGQVYDIAANNGGPLEDPYTGKKTSQYSPPSASLVAQLKCSYTLQMQANSIFRILASITLACILLTNSPLFAYEISSSAIVNEDGTLRIKGKTIHLYGIHIPRTDRTCRSHQLPTVCGSRAAIALDFKIDGFVRCEILDELDDGSIVGWCRVNASRFDEGEDLSAYLLEMGWAVALPDAPFEYKTAERIAQSRQFGVWGIPVDRVVGRPDIQ